MFDRFTDRAKKVMSLARQEALQLGHEDIGTGHMLLGILTEGSGVAATVLREDVDFEDVRATVEGVRGRGDAASGRGQLPFTPRARRLLELSLEEAGSLRHNYIGTEHLLLGLLREPDGVGGLTLRRPGCDVGALRRRVLEFLGDAPDEASPSPAAMASDRFQDAMLRRLVTRWRQRGSAQQRRVVLVRPAGLPAAEQLVRQVVEPALRGAIVVEHKTGAEGTPPLAARIHEADLAVVVFLGHDPDAAFALATCLANSCLPVVIAERREQLPTELRGMSWIRWAPGDALDDALRSQVAAVARPLLGPDPAG